MEVSKDQIAVLLENGLYESAQMLGCYLVSSAAANAESSPYLKAEALVLQGDALYEENELRRALHMYKQALQLCKTIPKQTTPVSRSSVTSSNMPFSPNSLNGSTINENEVKFKICLCYCKLNENRAALAEMDGIPSKARTLRMNLVLGKLLRISRHNRASIACYRDCIRQCPYVLEAISALAELGVSAKDILVLFPQTPNRGRLPLDHSDTGRWLHHCWLEHDPAYSIHERWIYIHRSWILYCLIIHSDMLRPNAALLPMIIKKVQDFWSSANCPWLNDLRLFLGDILCHGGLDNFSELLQRFPNNVHILLEIAKVEAIIGRNDEAIMNFEKVRSIDPYVMTYMDEYAMILKAKSEHSKLNKLVHDLLVIDPKRVEVSVTLSVLWERKDENKALAYAEKSVRMDDRHIAGHVMKGNLLLQLKRSDAAVTAFRAAQELRPDLRSYQGLVRSFLALSKTKEALYAAREAMKAMPQSAKALKLVGDVHASNPGGREKARKFYESALRLEPGFLGAALALAELHVVEGRNKDAVSLLERYLKDWADDSLHIKLAQVFAATDVLSEALSHYQAALRINPQNEAARKGLERLEKLMKGLDPDAPEEDEDNEVEDADGDQEEAELL